MEHWKSSIGGLLLGLFLISAIFIIAVFNGIANKEEKREPSETVSDTDQRSAVSVVESFGAAMQFVPLSGEEEVTRASIESYYAHLLAPELLEDWKNNSAHALGRYTSSPWPERIAITGIERDSEDYVIEGDVIEVANGENGTQVVARTPVEFRVSKINGEYKIFSVSKIEGTISEEITITGVRTCLLKKGDAQTTECAYGLKAEDGEYYALDFQAHEFEGWWDIPREEQITIRGNFVPVEALSSDHWQTYYMRGIIRVLELQH